MRPSGSTASAKRAHQRPPWRLMSCDRINFSLARTRMVWHQRPPWRLMSCDRCREECSRLELLVHHGCRLQEDLARTETGEEVVGGIITVCFRQSLYTHMHPDAWRKDHLEKDHAGARFKPIQLVLRAITRPIPMKRELKVA